MARKFDEIVAFGELETAIDRQVKFYSSGMHVRLGFAIAAFTEPDVLLVDEVLAVGDAAFQQKQPRPHAGRAGPGHHRGVRLHDLQAVESICERAVWLRDGVVESDGPVRDVLGDYRRTVEQAAEILTPAFGLVRVASEIRGPGGDTPVSQQPLEVKLPLESPEPIWASMSIGVSEGPATPIFLLGHEAMLPGRQTEPAARSPSCPAAGTVLPLVRHHRRVHQGPGPLASGRPVRGARARADPDAAGHPPHGAGPGHTHMGG